MKDRFRFASTAIITKEPLLVILVSGMLVVAVLFSGWFTPNGMGPAGIWSRFGLSVFFLVVCAAVGWLLGYSEEIIIDPAARVVDQSYRFLHYVTAKNQFSFGDFTAIRVERKVSKDSDAASSPSLEGESSSYKTLFESSYTLSLVRADTKIIFPDKQLTVPNYPMILLKEKQSDPEGIERLALRLSRVGGWPAKRRHYDWVESEGNVQSMPFNYEAVIGVEAQQQRG